MPVYLSVLAVGIGLKAHLNKPQLWRVQFESVADGLETLGIMLYGGNKHIFEVCLSKEVQISCAIHHEHMEIFRASK